MYSLSQLRRGFKSPNLFFRELNRLYHRRLNSRSYNTDGIDIFDEDWDNLLILDACRFDMLEDNQNLSGQLESRISKGSATYEFLKGNFDGRSLLDTVYVTANPQLYRNRHRIDTKFHKVVNIWEEEGWDEEYGTVLPETVTRRATETAKRYPNKRLIVHFIQPHYPFLGSDTSFDKEHLSNPDTEEENVWNQLMEGSLTIDRDTIWDMYVENLEITLPHVESLLEELLGKSVITADHGNMVGERAFPFPIREWGHPRGLYTSELVRVPWLILEGNTRKETVAEEAETESSSTESDVVADRLKQLGYAE